MHPDFELYITISIWTNSFTDIIIIIINVRCVNWATYSVFKCSF